jgi:hypothetical protein
LQRRFPQTFHRGFPFGIANGRRDRLEHVDLGAQIRLRLHDAADAEALQGVDDQERGALGLPDEFQNLANRADAEEIFRSRLFGLDHPLPDHADHATLRQTFLEQLERVRAPMFIGEIVPGKMTVFRTGGSAGPRVQDGWASLSARSASAAGAGTGGCSSRGGDSLSETPAFIR